MSKIAIHSDELVSDSWLASPHDSMNYDPFLIDKRREVNVSNIGCSQANSCVADLTYCDPLEAIVI